MPGGSACIRGVPGPKSPAMDPVPTSGADKEPYTVIFAGLYQFYGMAFRRHPLLK
jgi:hypothetical protein